MQLFRLDFPANFPEGKKAEGNPIAVRRGAATMTGRTRRSAIANVPTRNCNTLWHSAAFTSPTVCVRAIAKKLHTVGTHKTWKHLDALREAVSDRRKTTANAWLETSVFCAELYLVNLTVKNNFVEKLIALDREAYICRGER